MGLSVWPMFTMLGCSITIWDCLGGLLLGCSITVWVSLRPIISLRMFYNSVSLSGANFFIAWMLHNSVGVSGWPIFSLLGCSITVWVCLDGLFLHCLDVL